MARNPLTPKVLRFIEEYLVDLNGAHAAKRAGYSAKSAKEIAYELLGKPAVAEAIAAASRRRQRHARKDLQRRDGGHGRRRHDAAASNQCTSQDEPPRSGGGGREAHGARHGWQPE